MEKALIKDLKDNVATTFVGLKPGEKVSIPYGQQRIEVTIRDTIPFGHKVAIKHIDKGADVIKYGAVIGRSTTPIEIGQHVHVHNVESKRMRGDVKWGD